MKRSYSDSESEDGFGDDDCSSINRPGSPSQSCHTTSNRKKRRGIIEKRRRDRINNSLGELRRLVPSAYEKQGSAKLEKAEILQMTVDHLKMLNAKGLNGYNLDSAALAMDYRAVGFRECMAEVARYLVSIEGMDIQDPLRLRLTSHLQCYSTQREVASKAAAASGLQHSAPGSAWNLPSHSFNAQYTTGGAAYGSLPPPPASMISQTGAGPHHNQPDHLSSLSNSPASMKLAVSYPESSRLHQSLAGASHGPSGLSLAPTPHTTNASLGSAAHCTTGAGHMLSGLSQMTSQFPTSLNSSMSLLSPHYNVSQSSLSQGAMKPHRPWGTELAF